MLPDPFITCAFINDKRIAVAMFYNYKNLHIHFIYNHEKHDIEGEPEKVKMKCSSMNFPWKTFYNPEDEDIYCFYRHGQVITINAANSNRIQKAMSRNDLDNKGPKTKLDVYKIEQMTDKDLGQMFLINNKALIARSSSTILFFKIMADEEDPEQKKWTQYYSLNIRGFLYFIKGNIRIQVITDEKIYFYVMDFDTLMPHLDNVMFNYMGCN